MPRRDRNTPRLSRAARRRRLERMERLAMPRRTKKERPVYVEPEEQPDEVPVVAQVIELGAMDSRPCRDCQVLTDKGSRCPDCHTTYMRAKRARRAA